MSRGRRRIARKTAMPPIRLHCFGESGNAYKAALMLELCGLEWMPVPIDFFNGEARSPAWRAKVNEMGEAPVLEHGEKKLTQSGVMLDYLARITGKFGGADDTEREEIWRWILFDNHKFTANIATLRFLVCMVKIGETPVTEFLRGRANAAAAIVDLHLSKSAFMIGAHPTIADISLCGYLYYPEDYGIDWMKYPHIQRWLAAMKALPGWKAPYDLMARAPARRG
jgi:glutathione S-transferase